VVRVTLVITYITLVRRFKYLLVDLLWFVNFQLLLLLLLFRWRRGDNNHFGLNLAKLEWKPRFRKTLRFVSDLLLNPHPSHHLLHPLVVVEGAEGESINKIFLVQRRTQLYLLLHYFRLDGGVYKVLFFFLCLYVHDGLRARLLGLHLHLFFNLRLLHLSLLFVLSLLICCVHLDVVLLHLGGRLFVL